MADSERFKGQSDDWIFTRRKRKRLRLDFGVATEKRRPQPMWKQG